MLDKVKAIDKNFEKQWYIKPLIAWVVWLLCGTLVYAYPNKLGWSKGFYMAVNVGYSIGWGWPQEINHAVMWYSVFHLLVGASAVAAALGYFARNMIAVSKNWYVQALQAERAQSSDTWYQNLWFWMKLNTTPLRIIGLWMWWITMMVIFSCVMVKWDFIDGLYFALSSLSTGGLWAIPSDSPNWYFGVVGLFSATGIPLMGAAMSSIASMVISVGDPEETDKIINAKVTEDELAMMQKFGIDDGDGEISRAEYILLCAMRLGAMTPDLIAAINDRFNGLDADHNGKLSYDELLEHPERAHHIVLASGRSSVVVLNGRDEILKELERRKEMGIVARNKIIPIAEDVEDFEGEGSEDHSDSTSSDGGEAAVAAEEDNREDAKV